MKNSLLLFGLIAVMLNFSCEKDDKTPCSALPVVNAGTDIVLCNTTSVALKGNTNATSGTWSIISGNGGSITMSHDTAHFTGVISSTYKLKYESTNSCGISSDTINVSFESVDCGNDLTVDQMVNNITWKGQSTFKIMGSKFKIYTDPINITQNDDADIILITHPHSDHFSASSIDRLTSSKTYIIGPSDCNYTGTCFKRIMLMPGEEYLIKGCVKIKAVPAYNITKAYHPKENLWVGYLITVNGVTIYHAGDTERIPEMKNLNCDIAMLPLGQIYTMNSVSDAAESAKDVHASVAIPMHYGPVEGTAADANTFKDLLEGTINVVIK
jgi:L-ascorbate metabolism protein UlaG (beta-lactamase superfamily)